MIGVPVKDLREELDERGTKPVIPNRCNAHSIRFFAAGQIDDCQSAMTEENARGLVHELILAIGSAVNERSHHSGDVAPRA